MYRKLIEKKLERKLDKLWKRDSELFRAVDAKMDEILLNPSHYKPLRWPMQNLRRVHIGSQVLVFYINEEEKTVEFFSFKHHDEAYY